MPAGVPVVAFGLLPVVGCELKWRRESAVCGRREESSVQREGPLE